MLKLLQMLPQTFYYQQTDFDLYVCTTTQREEYLFQTNIDTIVTTNQCEKMSIKYTVPGFEPRTS